VTGGEAESAKRSGAAPLRLALATRVLALYRPTTIKTPAAIERIAITVPSPEKLRLSRGISPIMISQAANNSIPRFLVTFIGRLL
jgi:hypothetical protein